MNYTDPTGHSAIAGWLIWEAAKILGEYALAGLAGYLTAKAVHKLVSTPHPKTTTSSPRADPGGSANRTAGGGFSLPQRSAGDYVESFPWGVDVGYSGTIIDPIPTAQELSDYVERFPWSDVVMPRVLLAKKVTSANQMQKQIERKQAPKGVIRVDKSDAIYAEPHVHFADGTALDINGKVHDKSHGIPNLTNEIKKWLSINGWSSEIK